ncbi:aminopeptidase Y [Ascoidea rubescens DSM 1968]|uniref:Peptide hydrolase n=1 Tax=Ascoidea rubescens DSM 1968 TaxID=1344418 RepID=A0A1D2VJE5_9ASCO|nr:vacuolar aminopeptidase Y, processed to mature form by Prb1p [Ascoidea rubescens DSM 1968]ODV61700.1 vacuolar aminopeptidase Y, processed to mature form by Prb1p [Ascoidea rubescens DSM 1968]
MKVSTALFSSLSLCISASSSLYIPLSDSFSNSKLSSLLSFSLSPNTYPNIDELPLIDTQAYQNLVNVTDLESGANDLYSFAEYSIKQYDHPTRVIGSKGHWKTIGYILSTLNRYKYYYDISTQDFFSTQGKVKFSMLKVNDQLVEDAQPLSLTPPTPNKKAVTGPLVLVDNEGCDVSDFKSNEAAIKDSIVLIKRGTCPFGLKSQLAGQFGALAAVIYNNEPGLFQGTLGEPLDDQVASLGISSEVASIYIDELKNGATLNTTVVVDSYIQKIKTTNVIATSKSGDQDNVVMLGGHTDSVEAGPGINDDGSGTISLLNLAVYLTNFKLNNAVRFAFWAAEEEGLVGSTFYVNSLSPKENSKIRLFMDYDMMGSPNYAYQVYDANNNDNPIGSEELKNLYIDWYTENALNYTLIRFDGRSDYDAFIKNGIPGGGIATGAEGIKTKQEASMFGGVAGDWYDPCYHQLCDDLSNPNYEAWEINTRLIAHSVATYAKSLKAFPLREDLIYSQTHKVPVFKYHGDHLII